MCLLLCRGLPSIAAEELQTLQLLNSMHFTMLCAMQRVLEQSRRGLASPTASCSILFIFAMLSAMQSIPEHSRRGLTNPTFSQLFNSQYLNVFAAMQGTPEHTNRRIANPTVVQFSTFLHASFSTKLKCKKYLLAMWQVSFSMVLQTLRSVQLFLSPYFTMLLQCKALPSIANEALQTLQSVVHVSIFYHAFCSAKHSEQSK